jgi:hypothetical protein
MAVNKAIICLPKPLAVNVQHEVSTPQPDHTLQKEKIGIHTPLIKHTLCMNRLFKYQQQNTHICHHKKEKCSRKSHHEEDKRRRGTAERSKIYYII